MKEISLHTHHRSDLVEITREVQTCLREAGARPLTLLLGATGVLAVLLLNARGPRPEESESQARAAKGVRVAAAPDCAIVRCGQARPWLIPPRVGGSNVSRTPASATARHARLPAPGSALYSGAGCRTWQCRSGRLSIRTAPARYGPELPWCRRHRPWGQRLRTNGRGWDAVSSQRPLTGGLSNRRSGGCSLRARAWRAPQPVGDPALKV